MKQQNKNTQNGNNVLLHIINVLEDAGITDNKEIVKIGSILSNPDKIRGLKRSITVARQNAKKDFYNLPKKAETANCCKAQCDNSCGSKGGKEGFKLATKWPNPETTDREVLDIAALSLLAKMGLI